MAAPTAKIPNKDLRKVSPERQGASDLDYLQQYGQNPDAANGAAIPDKDLRTAAEKQGTTAPTEAESEGKAQQESTLGKPPLPPGTPDPSPAIETAKTLVSHLPKPQSLVFPLVIIIVFWVLVQKVNGKSRLEWVLDVLTGGATLTNTNANNFGGGGGASFGAGAGNTAGGVGATLPSGRVPIDMGPTLAQAFHDTPETVTDLDAGTFQPSAAHFVPTSSIAMASEY